VGINFIPENDKRVKVIEKRAGMVKELQNKGSRWFLALPFQLALA